MHHGTKCVCDAEVEEGEEVHGNHWHSKMNHCSGDSGGSRWLVEWEEEEDVEVEPTIEDVHMVEADVLIANG